MTATVDDLIADGQAALRPASELLGAVPNYLRIPFGPGWALVGDAGYNKDPITAQGISDAFRDAEQCSTAVDNWLSGRMCLTMRSCPGIESGIERSFRRTSSPPAGHTGAALARNAAIARRYLWQPGGNGRLRQR